MLLFIRGMIVIIPGDVEELGGRLIVRSVVPRCRRAIPPVDASGYRAGGVDLADLID